MAKLKARKVLELQPAAGTPNRITIYIAFFCGPYIHPTCGLGLRVRWEFPKFGGSGCDSKRNTQEYNKDFEGIHDSCSKYLSPKWP